MASSSSAAVPAETTAAPQSHTEDGVPCFKNRGKRHSPQDIAQIGELVCASFPEYHEGKAGAAKPPTAFYQRLAEQTGLWSVPVTASGLKYNTTTRKPRTTWTDEETSHLLELHRQYGSQWQKIRDELTAQRSPGKPELTVKHVSNHFHNLQKLQDSERKSSESKTFLVECEGQEHSVEAANRVSAAIQVGRQALRQSDKPVGSAVLVCVVDGRDKHTFEIYSAEQDMRPGRTTRTIIYRSMKKARV